MVGWLEIEELCTILVDCHGVGSVEPVYIKADSSTFGLLSGVGILRADILVEIRNREITAWRQVN